MLLFGGVLFGVGLHHMVATGTCSSTGYSADYGPVPHCPKGTGWWFAFLFGGIFMVIIGAFVSGGSSVALLIPVIFSAIGIGALTVAFDKHVAHGTKLFGLVFGGVFALIGLIGAVVIAFMSLGKLRSKSKAPPSSASAAGSASLLGGAPATAATASGVNAFGTPSAASAFGSADSQPDAILGAYNASAPATSVEPSVGLSSSVPAGGVAAGHPSGDVLDKIAKLSALHQSGGADRRRVQP